MNFQGKDFEYSTNNIPLATKNTFLLNRMCWKAIFFLDNDNTHGAAKEIYGFKSKRSAPHVNALNEFEDSMLAMIQKIEFRNNYHPNILQQKLAADVKEIGRDKHIFVKADKTTNHYITEPNACLTLVHKNVTKACKKTHQNVPNLITSVDKEIAKKN